MARPHCCRRISQEPSCAMFKPAGIPGRSLEEIVLTLDEFEALRLADLNGLYQEQAALSMNVSRQTFGRIIGSARRKIAQVLILGKVLKIEGGKVECNEMRPFKCRDCQHTWEQSSGDGHAKGCPKCGSATFCGENAGSRECTDGQIRGNTYGRKRCRQQCGPSTKNSQTLIVEERES